MPNLLTTMMEREAAREDFSTDDYGREGDQRPYTAVIPAYPTPRFLQSYYDLGTAVRDCKRTANNTGCGVRVIRWGRNKPCVALKGTCLNKSAAQLPSMKFYASPGALEGYPEATPIADVLPNGKVIAYTPDGGKRVVGDKNYILSPVPVPPSDVVNEARPPEKRYDEAVEAAQFLAGNTGQRIYVCSGFNADCKQNKLWIPMVYVEPGGLVARYPLRIGHFGKSTKGSMVVTNPVSPEEFRELIAISEGRTLVPHDAL